MKIIVDADSCPVMEEIIQVAERHNVRVIFAADYAHYFEFNSPLVEVRLVDGPAQAVDTFVMNSAKAGDVVITQDIGLSAFLVSKGVVVLTPKGKVIRPRQMNSLLERRHYARRLRRAGVRMKSYARSFTRRDRVRFVRILDFLLKKLSAGEGNESEEPLSGESNEKDSGQRTKEEG